MARFGEKELGVTELTSIVEATKQYWRDWDSKAIPVSLEKYINNLLSRELDAAHKIEAARQDEGKRLPDDFEKANTLVLLVGFSFEPLLQSVYAYKPKKVLLVLNDIYSESIDGQMVGDWLTKLIRKLPAELLPEQPEEIGALEINESTGEEQFVTQPAQPEKVFQFLIDQLLRNPKADKNGRIVIDITGAKKSMVTGAYLFGALTNCTLSYVDFDAYEPERFRAYGYSCRIGKIGNPYQSFQIANWRRVQERYNYYALGEAAELLNAIITNLSEANLFKRKKENEIPEELVKLGQLKKVLEFYASWDAGDIPKAYEQWISEIKNMGIEAPMVIQVLGPEWERKYEAFKQKEQVQDANNANGKNDANAFMKSKATLSIWTELLGRNKWTVMLTYACDELAKIQRMATKKGDWRAAFIRAANLHEYLLKVRLLMLASDNKWLKLEVGNQEQIFRLAFYDASDAIEYVLETRQEERWERYKWKNKKKQFTLAFSQGENLASNSTLRMAEGWEDVVDDFRDLRNSVVHNFSVITKDSAELALKFIAADWENLLEVWAKQLNISINLPKPGEMSQDPPDTKFELPEWKMILGYCSIDFLPIFDDTEKPIQEQPS